jgi:hypothetical protein
VPGSLVVICCGNCGERVKVDVENAKSRLRYHGQYGFGAHVTDIRAFAMRLMHTMGWQYKGRHIAKSTLTMMCPKCVAHAPMTTDADAAAHG